MIRLLIFLFLTTSSLQTNAIDTLIIGKDLFHEYILGGQNLEILEDSSKILSFNDILNKGLDQKFRLNKEPYAYNFNYSFAYWIKFVIKNESGTDHNFVLESYSPHTYLLQLFYIDDEGAVHIKQTGEAIHPDLREIQHKNLVLDLPVGKNHNVRTFYIRVFSNHHAGFDYRIKSFYYFSEYSTLEYYFLGIYYGILAIMALYNLIIFFTIKERVHLFYVLYILSGMVSTLTEDRLGYQLFWRGNAEINAYFAYYIAPVSLLVFFILYSIQFLSMRENYQKLYKIIIALTGLYLLLLITAVYIFSINLYILRFFYSLPFISVCISAYYIFFKGYKAARWFILGSSFIVASIIIIQLRADHLIAGNLVTVYFLNISLVIESVVLSLALSDRIKIFQKEKDQAQHKLIEEFKEKRMLQEMVNKQLQEKQVLQEKVNKELEEKVNERTQSLVTKTEELEIVNGKLQSIIEQANRMNIKLDIDNWELKKSVQNELLQRITGQEVSQEVFETIFKDDLICLKFLDELKWQKGYICRKCGNTRHKDIDNTYTRKCSKCSYPESVTSHTILHGIKFKLNKSLYLIYLIHKRNGKIKLEEISNIAGISIASSSKFKSKVEEQMNRLEKKKKGVVNWEEIIFEVRE